MWGFEVRNFFQHLLGLFVVTCLWAEAGAVAKVFTLTVYNVAVWNRLYAK